MSVNETGRGLRLDTHHDAEFRTNDYSKTADNALRLLSLISENGPIPTVQLAARSSLHRSVVRRLVNTLQGHGLIWSTPTGYVVGASVLALAEQVAPQLQVVMRPLMRDLADEIGETVLCTARRGTDAILLSQERGLRHLIRVEDEPGARHSIFLGASGPAILSLLDDPSLEKVLSEAAEGERERALEHIADVRKQGYCHSFGERQLGVAAIAAPVSGPAGEPLCSLGVIVPEIRARQLTDWALPLVDCARRAESVVSAEGPQK